jgi:hypothetical protein
VRVSYLLSFLCCGKMGACFLSSLFSVLLYDGERVSYLSSFLCCGRKGVVFLIFLVFCIVIGSGACFLSS